MKSWRATDNGLESDAALHSDAVLPLDEIQQASPRTVSEASYMLANGRGKSRARRDGTGRETKDWRVMTLSSGEVGCVEYIEADGGRAMAGQQVRLLEIPAIANMEKPDWGIVEDLHGFSGPKAYVQALQEAVGKAYGTAAREFIRKIQETGLPVVAADWREYLQENLDVLTGPGADGQTKRAAERFLLCAFAGECAAAWGILPWPQGMAYRAVTACFLAWLERRGGAGPAEEKIIVQKVTLYLQQHEQSRFPSPPTLQVDGVDGNEYKLLDEKTVVNRAGFRKTFPEDLEKPTHFYVFPDVFRKDILKGHDHKYAEKVLIRWGMLLPGGDGRPTVKPNFPGMKGQRFYLLILPAIGEDAECRD